MALINCPECGKEISSESTQCIFCGKPIKEKESYLDKFNCKQKILRKQFKQRKFLISVLCLVIFLCFFFFIGRVRIIIVDGHIEVVRCVNDIKLNDKGKYSGTVELIKGIPLGKGVLIYSNGSKYSGDFENGVENGHGRIEFNWGSYVGEIKNGTPNGIGTLKDFFGSNYSGMFRDGGIFNGSGIEVFSNGEKFKGTWENGRRKEGTVLYPDGSKYTGTFRDGFLSGGEGLKSYSDGSFDYYYPTGAVKHTEPDGSVYITEPLGAIVNGQ